MRPSHTYGLGSGHFGQSWFDRLLEHVRGLPRPLLLSLRNTFRRKGRLARTLFALALAGTMFIAVFNLRASMNITIDEILGYVPLGCQRWVQPLVPHG